MPICISVCGLVRIRMRAHAYMHFRMQRAHESYGYPHARAHVIVRFPYAVAARLTPCDAVCARASLVARRRRRMGECITVCASADGGVYHRMGGGAGDADAPAHAAERAGRRDRAVRRCCAPKCQNAFACARAPARAGCCVASSLRGRGGGGLGWCRVGQLAQELVRVKARLHVLRGERARVARVRSRLVESSVWQSHVPQLLHTADLKIYLKKEIKARDGFTIRE